MRFPSVLRSGAVFGAVAVMMLLAGQPALADEPAKTADAAAAEKAPEKKEARPGQGGLTESEIARAFKKYRKQVRDGNTVYCRNEKPVGTRIGKQVCYTEDQVIAAARAERDARDQLSQMNVCGAGSCSPGG